MSTKPGDGQCKDPASLVTCRRLWSRVGVSGHVSIHVLSSNLGQTRVHPVTYSKVWNVRSGHIFCAGVGGNTY